MSVIIFEADHSGIRSIYALHEVEKGTMLKSAQGMWYLLSHPAMSLSPHLVYSSPTSSATAPPPPAPCAT